MKQQKFEKGRVRISNDIIKLIAAQAALDVDGVEKLVTELGIETDTINDTALGAVEMEVVRDTVLVGISIAVDYKEQVHLVAREVQKNIKEKIEIMTGLHVTTVDVHVVDLVNY